MVTTMDNPECLNPRARCLPERIKFCKACYFDGLREKVRVRQGLPARPEDRQRRLETNDDQHRRDQDQAAIRRQHEEQERSHREMVDRQNEQVQRDVEQSLQKPARTRDDCWSRGR